MTIPVIESLRQAYPDVQVTLLSSGAAHAVYEAVAPGRNPVQAVRIKDDYAGITGLNRLFRMLYAEQFDAVADLHDVLRTQYLDSRFRMKGIPIAVIDKGRSDKRRLVRHTVFRPLTSGIERYHQVFRQLGFDFPIRYDPVDTSVLRNGIGIAPFAQHQGKIYPAELMEQVIRMLLDALPDQPLYLFGGGKREKEILDRWAAEDERITNMTGRYSLTDELLFMKRLHVMISMDSANMHFASLVGTPVVSVWGATHPYAGFLGYGQDPEHAVQLDLPCRPCSVYGKKTCRYGTWKCLHDIPPEDIVRQTLAVLHDTIQKTESEAAQ